MNSGPEQSQSVQVGRFYDEQAGAYAEFAEGSFSWKYIESPAFDRYIKDFYRPDARVLDFGCGAGRVIRHLVSRGIDPSNIAGIDTSESLLKIAEQDLPGVRLETASTASLPFEDESFDLITSNMVLHHMDNEDLRKSFDEAYRVLAPEGVLFFVDVDPDSSDTTRNPALTNTWLTKTTPWGTTVPHFNRDPHTLLVDVPYAAGFDLRAGWPLPIELEGLTADPEEFERYNSKPSRIAARFQKVITAEKERRQQTAGAEIPPLVSPTA